MAANNLTRENNPTRSCGCLSKETSAKRAKDLTGHRSGRLVAIRPTENRSGSGNVMWLCRCDCGNEVEVAAKHLSTQSTTRSCGCLQKERAKESAIDLTGQRFERLVAIRPTENRSGHNVKWLCHCDCGNEVEVAENNLVSEITRSCGCLRKERAKKRAIDLMGHRSGRLVAIKPTENRSGSGSVMWLCRCDCGNEVEVVAHCLTRKKPTRSCGCLRKKKRPPTETE